MTRLNHTQRTLLLGVSAGLFVLLAVAAMPLIPAVSRYRRMKRM